VITHRQLQHLVKSLDLPANVSWLLLSLVLSLLSLNPVEFKRMSPSSIYSVFNGGTETHIFKNVYQIHHVLLRQISLLLHQFIINADQISILFDPINCIMGAFMAVV